MFAIKSVKKIGFPKLCDLFLLKIWIATKNRLRSTDLEDVD